MHPYLFQIAGFEVRFYSLMIILAVLIGLFFAGRRAKTLSLDRKMVENAMLFIFFVGVLGARAYYVIFNWPYFSANPSEIIAIWHGGLAIHGGIIAVIVFGLIVCKVKKISPFVIADLFSPFGLLGQGIGRFGNFANGEAHGVPTITPPSVIFQFKPDFQGFWSAVLDKFNLQNTPQALTNFFNSSIPNTVVYRGEELALKEYVPWGVSFPAKFNSLAYQEFGSMPVHPTFFYEMILNFIGAFILIKLWKKDENIGSGKIFALYLVFYGIIRAFVTFFRADDLMFGPLRAPHMASIALLLIAAGWYYIATKVSKKGLTK